MSVVSVILSAVLERLANPQHPLLTFPPPDLLKQFLSGPLGAILCVKGHVSAVSNVLIDRSTVPRPRAASAPKDRDATNLSGHNPT